MNPTYPVTYRQVLMPLTSEDFPPLIPEPTQKGLKGQLDKNESPSGSESMKVNLVPQENMTTPEGDQAEDCQMQEPPEKSQVSHESGLKTKRAKVTVQKSSLSGTRLGRMLSQPQSERREMFLQFVKRPIEKVGQMGLRPRPIGNYLPTMLTCLPEKILLNVLRRLDTESICNLVNACRAHHVIGHRLKCLHFAAFLANESEKLAVKMKVLNDMARLPFMTVNQATSHSAIIHMTQAVSLQAQLPQGSEIRRQLYRQLKRIIPNGPLFRQAFPSEKSYELMDPNWMEYAKWFLSLGKEGESKIDLIQALEFRNLDPNPEMELCLEKPYSNMFR